MLQAEWLQVATGAFDGPTQKGKLMKRMMHIHSTLRIYSAVMVCFCVFGPLSVAQARSALQSYSEVERSLSQLKGKKNKKTRIRLLKKFVSDQRPTLADRRQATKRWLKETKSEPKAQIAALLAKARLAGVAGDGKVRKESLEKAHALAKKKDDKRRELLSEILETEALFKKVRKSLLKRVRKKERLALSDVELEQIARLRESTAFYKKIKDHPQTARVALAVALYEETSPADRKPVLKEFKEITQMKRYGRDTYPVVQKAMFGIVRIYEEQERYAEAVRQSFEIDRFMRVPLDQSMHQPKKKSSAHSRSRRTADLCERVRRYQVDCNSIEKKNYRHVSLYDFSTEKVKKRFQSERAEMVFHQYEFLLQGCVRKFAKSTRMLENTHVELEWPVEFDGSVSDFDLKPKRLIGTGVETCFRDALSLFRYPPYRGEMQHMRTGYSISE